MGRIEQLPPWVWAKIADEALRVAVFAYKSAHGGDTTSSALFLQRVEATWSEISASQALSIDLVAVNEAKVQRLARGS